jgi:hypothetical protein
VSDFNSGDIGTAVSTAAAATINHSCGQITTEALTTVAGGDYVMTLTSAVLKPTSMVFASVCSGTNTTVGLVVHEVTPGAGTCTIDIRNQHASAALNGTIIISFLIN